MARGGSPVPDVPPYRRMAAILFARRNDSAVAFEEAADVTETLPWIEAWNARGGPRLTFFVLLVHALARVLHEHPRLNRFVAARRLFQRDGVWLSFTVKKAPEPGAPLAVVKREFPPGEPLETLAREMGDRVAEARSDAPTPVDREVGLLLRLPRPIVMGLVALVRTVDFLGLLPASFVRGDPFFASAFLTNLGSVGGGAAYHHLYEYGNIPLFCTLGRVADEVVARDGAPVVRRIARLRFVYDERIEDGFNALRALARLRELIERPQLLVEGRAPA